jgi:Tfp pilus assembly protein PilV
MLKGNLSSRPFYNERLVAMVVMGAALLGVLLTIFNVTAFSRLSGERSRQQEEEQKSLSEAERVQQSAQKLQQSLTSRICGR